MSTISTDPSLETLSPLVNCSVDNVSRHMSVQMVFKFHKVICSSILKVWWVN